MIRRFLPLLCLAAPPLLTSCDKNTEPVPAPVYLLDQRWVLTEIEGQVPSTTRGATTDLVLNSVGSTNAGRAFCNNYGGKYLLTAGSAQLTFSAQYSTYATCAEQDQETHYFQLLPQVTRYTISNRRLALYDGEHTTPLLAFTAAE
ncbi:META domain-containing protein [Hymenobacter sp. HSC-4F20]|uniref:META domain-containing protein n=1 Tax=Hymenobacter sp. HSC-4F20 TaxID=2864135 RepID=UPI001C72C26A|nr:META domain-containing protein [Hymenobacter sp. HSC-4F20]MBX0291417.1 META domain-containing protein [Hymenobacter sp. HSC-4F20]